jgi:hypothetical protein
MAIAAPPKPASTQQATPLQLGYTMPGALTTAHSTSHAPPLTSVMLWRCDGGAQSSQLFW